MAFIFKDVYNTISGLLLQAYILSHFACNSKVFTKQKNQKPWPLTLMQKQSFTFIAREHSTKQKKMEFIEYILFFLK